MYAALNYHCHEETRRQESIGDVYTGGMNMYQYIRMKVESQSVVKKSPVKRTASKGVHVPSKSAAKPIKIDAKTSTLATSASHASKLSNPE